MHEIKELYNHIYPIEEERERMFDELLKEDKTKKKTKRPFKIMVAVASIAIVCCSVPIIANTVAPYFEDVKDVKIAQDDIKDGETIIDDGHIQMKVEKTLSDGRVFYVVVSYESLDNVGKEWMKGKVETESPLTNYNLSVGVEEDYLVQKNLSLSCNVAQLADSTENKKYFSLICTVNGSENIGDTVSDHMVINYKLTDEKDQIMDLNIESKVERNVVQLDPQKGNGITVVPVSFQYSSISWALYVDAKYDNVKDYYNAIRAAEPSLSNVEEPHYDEILDTNLVYKDGTKLSLQNGAYLDICYDEGKEMLKNIPYGNGKYVTEVFQPQVIDLEEVVGLEINGVLYDIK